MPAGVKQISGHHKRGQTPERGGPQRLCSFQPCRYLNSAAHGPKQPESDGPALRGGLVQRPPEVLSNLNCSISSTSYSQLIHASIRLQWSIVLSLLFYHNIQLEAQEF